MSFDSFFATAQPLYFTLRGVRYENNSVIALSSIGEGDDALHAITGDPECCRIKRIGEFYFPNGTQVPINSANQPLYRNRDPGLIRLHRRASSSSEFIPIGRYRSELPDDCGKIVSLYVNLGKFRLKVLFPRAKRSKRPGDERG